MFQAFYKNYYPECKDCIIPLEPPLASGTVHIHVMFSKKIAGYEQRLKDFNRGLQVIIIDGTLTRIENKYQIPANLGKIKETQQTN